MLNIPDNHLYPLDAFVVPACYRPDLSSVLIPHGMICDRIKRLAQQINAQLGDQPLAVLCILKGSYRFFTVLVDELTVVRANGANPMTVDFIRLKSYEDRESTGRIEVIGLSSLTDLNDQHILIVDDIIDSGRTMQQLLRVVADYRPKSVTTAVLLSKRVVPQRIVDINVDFIAFSIPNEFVVGYGLDYNQKFRDLNHICIMSEAGIDKFKRIVLH